MAERINYNNTVERKINLENFPVVIFDIDGTICASAESVYVFAKKYLTYFKIDFNEKDFETVNICKWDMLTSMLTNCGLSEDAARHFDRTIWNHAVVVRDADPVPEAQALVELFVEKGKRLVAATSRPADERLVGKHTHDWMKKHFPDIAEVFISPKDAPIKGAENKAQKLIDFALEYGGAILVEDFPGHADKIFEYLQKNAPDANIHIILIPYPKVPVSDYLCEHPQVTIIQRDENLGLKHVVNYVAQS